MRDIKQEFDLKTNTIKQTSTLKAQLDCQSITSTLMPLKNQAPVSFNNRLDYLSVNYISQKLVAIITMR